MGQQEFLKYIKGYRPKDFLIKEGGEDKDFYCLLQGTVSIWKGDVKDVDKLVKVGEFSEKGTYFGEMSYFLGEKRTASIRAVDNVRVLKFPGEMMETLVQKQPQLALKICKTLADRLKGTTSKTEEVAHHRDELREDVSSGVIQAKESYKKVFMLLTAVQLQFQQPLLKFIIEYMTANKLLQGGKRTVVDAEFLHDVPEKLQELLKKAFPEE